MKKLLTSRIPMWVFVATLVGACLGILGFGVLTYDAVSGKHRFGSISAAVAAVAAAPENMVRGGRKGDAMAAAGPDRFAGRAGWTHDPDGPQPGGYMLLARFDGDVRRPVVELVALDDPAVLHRWEISVEPLLEGANWDNFVEKELLTNERYRVVHPLPAENGDLFIKGHYGPLIRITPCGELVWLQDATNFQYSIARDPDGNLWVPTNAATNSFGEQYDFRDDSLTQVSPDGEILTEISIARLLIENGLMGAVFSLTHPFESWDPTHLNDIEPVPGDGPFWKKGDVFVSLRRLSMVALVRPSTRELVWYRMGGPWLSQHDVDIVDDRTISVFSNNAYNMGRGGYIEGANEVMVYDLATDTVTSPLRDAMAAEEMLTVREGQSTVTGDGFVVLEETERGRVLVLRETGERYAEYINRGANGVLYRMNWSRPLDRAEGERLLAAVTAAECGG